MELGVSHVQNLSSLTPIVDNIFDKYNKNLVPIRSLSDHDILFNFCVFYSVCDTIQGTFRGHFTEITLTSYFHRHFCTNILHQEHYYWIVTGSP